MAIYIGTSGWAHKEWGKKFFPKEVTHKKQLAYLADHFNTVEVNATFYRNQTEETFKKWVSETPDDFVFAVKVSRYITHIKRLKKFDPYWKRFAEPTRGLGKKRGPFLVQLPPSWDGREENRERLNAFLGTARKVAKGARFAVELRHKDCFSEEMFTVLRKHNAALVIANSAKYPNPPVVETADFGYFRLHGPRKLFASSYRDDELREQAKQMRKFIRGGKDLFVYFNNDMHAYAPANAKLLQKLLKAPR